MGLFTRPDRRVWLAAVCLTLLASVVALGFHFQAAPSAPQPVTQAAKYGERASRANAAAIDRSGRQRFGKASFYADRFGGRKMANGQLMDLQGDNAASRTLPLGTTAKVTNLNTGQSTVVVIQDRGPYVDGRIVDLSPSTAEKIGLTRKEGVAQVAVSPITVPMPDGRVKRGAAASDQEVAANRSERDAGKVGGGL